MVQFKKDDHLVDDKKVKEVCKLGQGAECCRYIVMGGKGFECAKLYGKQLIDSKVDGMTAKADNCEGI